MSHFKIDTMHCVLSNCIYLSISKIEFIRMVLQVLISNKRGFASAIAYDLSND